MTKTVTSMCLLVMLIPGFIKEMKNAHDRLESISSQVISTSYGDLEYVVSGEGYPIIVSHGITGGVDQGLGMAEDFLGEGLQIIAVSRFGYLKSSLPDDSTPAAQAYAYAELLDELNIEKALVFGNSAGGSGAIQFALRHPERCEALVLVSSAVPVTEALPPKPVMRMIFGSDFIYYAMCTLFKKQMISSVLISEEMTENLSDQEIDDLYRRVFLSGLPISSRTDGVLNDNYVSNHDMNVGDYAFEEISVATLMIQAVDDPIIPIDNVRTVAARIPDVVFKEIEDGGHIYLGREQEVKDTIISFLQEQNIIAK